MQRSALAGPPIEPPPTIREEPQHRTVCTTGISRSWPMRWASSPEPVRTVGHGREPRSLAVTRKDEAFRQLAPVGCLLANAESAADVGRPSL